jgi:hypothetical protein
MRGRVKVPAEVSTSQPGDRSLSDAAQITRGRGVLDWALARGSHVRYVLQR